MEAVLLKPIFIGLILFYGLQAGATDGTAIIIKNRNCASAMRKIAPGSDGKMDGGGLDKGADVVKGRRGKTARQSLPAAPGNYRTLPFRPKAVSPFVTPDSVARKMKTGKTGGGHWSTDVVWSTGVIWGTMVDPNGGLSGTGAPALNGERPINPLNGRRLITTSRGAIRPF